MMEKKYVKNLNEEPEAVKTGAIRHHIFTAEDTPIPGCSSMHIVWTRTEYKSFDSHEDNEGFYVVRGNGRFWLEGTEYDISAGTAMYAPAGMRHAVRSAGGELEVFIYHFPA